MVGFLTSRKFHFTSFFVEDRSYYSFSCHQETTNSKETITAKQVYEVDVRKYVKEVIHCHVENVTCAVARCKE